MPDKILLHGMVFFGHHGNNAEEQVLGQRFVVDVELYCDLSIAGHSDRIRDTMNYSTAYGVVKRVLEGPSKRLLEALTEEVAEELLHTLPLQGVLVRIEKPSVPIQGVLDYAGVEIVRWAPGASSS